MIEAGGDEDTAIAAILHDAVEDQGGDDLLERIRDRFGNAVADNVNANSDTSVTPKPPWRERKEAYIASIPHKSPDTLLVSIADKLHNARAVLADHTQIGEAVWSRFTGGRDGTLWYYRALTDAFRNRAPRTLCDQLDEVVTALERRAAATIGS